MDEAPEADKYLINLKTKLIDRENRMVVAGGGGVGEMGEVGQEI